MPLVASFDAAVSLNAATEYLPYNLLHAIEPLHRWTVGPRVATNLALPVGFQVAWQGLYVPDV